MTLSTLTVQRRFRGPARSGNGGYTAGLLAGALHAASGSVTATVTLRQPPPLDAPMAVLADGAGVRLTHGGDLVAEAAAGEFTGRLGAPVEYGAAVEASARYDGFDRHPFPGCFTCGPERTDGDGLRLFPGSVPGRDGTVAAPWVPHRAVADPSGPVPAAIVWAALDCPGGWSFDLIGRPMVLGRITARVDAVPAVGQRCVVVGHARGVDGRKGFTDSALYTEDGALLALAEATWIAVDPAAINALA
jgi:hypothetical protein